MQKVLFIFLFLVSLILADAKNSVAQSSTKIDLADSLFQATRYTQSLEIYRDILENNQSSPSMLLKMAFISEGLDRVDDALLYLNLYYLKTSSESVLEKMETIATANNLYGYVANDNDYLFTLYYRYFEQIVYATMGAILLMLFLIVFQKLKYKTRPFASGIFFVLFLGLLFYLVNFGKSSGLGIIQGSSTPVMSGPSSGSKMISIIQSGHKVKVLGEEDVWVKVLWEGKEVYIKKQHINSIDRYL